MILNSRTLAVFRMIVYGLVGNRDFSIKKLCKVFKTLQKREAKVIGLGRGKG